MNNVDLQDKLNTTDTYTFHMEDGKSLCGTILDFGNTLLHIKQINGDTKQVINEVIIPISKISAIVIELPVVAPDAPIDI